MNFDEILVDFGKMVGKLKSAYAEKHGCNPSYLFVSINEDDYVTIIPTNETGSYIETFRDWVDTDK